MDDLRAPEVSLPEPEDAPPRGRRWAFLLLFVVFAAALAGGVVYWLQARHYESTDDAAVDGHISQLAAQIGGRVIAVLAEDNQEVRAGQVLVRIDPRDYQVRLEQAEAQQVQARAQAEQSRANLLVREADAAHAAANVHVAEADLQQSRQDLARYRAINPRAITRQTLDTALTGESGAAARLDASRQMERGARAQQTAAAAELAAADAAVRLADAGVANAQLQLSYTQVVAPAAGRIARRTVELGNYVNPGQALLAIVQPELWVTANFKETQLTDMRPGQAVRVRIDAFPGETLAARVGSIQPGTGAVFSAMPAENATGNYVKVVQRVPVKILFDGQDWRRLDMAPGMSVTARVQVR